MLPGSILQKLADACAARGSAVRYGVYYKNTLVALCHALEDSIQTANSEPLVVTAFQMGKWYLQEADRYNELAARSRQTVIMAAPDAGFADHPTSQREDVSLVFLDPGDSVAQEWHLMILAPSYRAMVLCQELSPADYGPDGMPEDDLERKFYGFWTFDPALVEEAIRLAIAHAGRYDAPLQAQLEAHLAAIAEETPTAQPDDLNAIVARVVTYLQDSQVALHPGQSAPPSGRPDAILDDNLLSNELQAFLRLAELIDRADPLNPNAAAEAAVVAETLGQLLNLPAWQIKRLRLASLLHRIAPLDSAASDLAAEAEADGDCCCLTSGAQVLRTMPRLRAVAQIVTHRGERWDGKGQPAGLARDAIPLESRVLGLAVDFQARTAALAAEQPNRSQADRLEAVLTAYAEDPGRWDPKLLDTLTLMVRALQQGWSLPAIPVKAASGLWLLDEHTARSPLEDEGGPMPAEAPAEV